MWKAMIKETLRRHGDVCVVCGHGGSTSADHLEPVTEAPAREHDLSNLRPCHAWPKACQTCSEAAGRPIYCNSIKGMGSLERAKRKISIYTGLDLDAEPDSYDDW
jgi:hypothetical protein